MLFSATLEKRVEELARLSLKQDPVFINIDEKREVATAEGLEQVPVAAALGLCACTFVRFCGSGMFRSGLTVAGLRGVQL